MSEQDESTETMTAEPAADATVEVAAEPAAERAAETKAEPKKKATRKKTAKKATTRTRTRTTVSKDDAATPAKDDDADTESAGSSKDTSSRDGSSKKSKSGSSKSGDKASAKKSKDGEASDATGDDATEDGKDDDGDSSSSRRRRRGSRGGRGRAKSSSAESGEDGDDAGQDDEAGSADEAGDGKSKADRETEAAIAKGGTRMAAKRRGRGGSSGGGGGGNRSGRDGRGGRGGPRGVSEETRRAILDGPPRTMLVTHTEDRTQIVVMEDRRAVEHYVTHAGDVTYVGNIYMARVQNVLPGMEAAFLDIGKGRNGVLYAGEVLYDEQDLEDSVPRIEDTLKPGQKVLVQVTKDPMGTKGPRLTQHLSLAGRYCVLAPNSDLFGISRKLTDKERDRLRRIVKKVKPEQHGIIVRTAAENASDEALTADLERLLAKWDKVEEAAKDAKPMTAVYEEPKLVVKVIRDNFGPEFERCIVDDKALFDEVKAYLEEVAPELEDKVELYEPKTEGEHDKPETLLGAYNVAEQLRKATERKVWLPSGGYLIIETTEAMKVVDVNTGKFTGSKDTSLEEVVLKTNLEAADEIVRQMRLRDMGGIIIIDFIDMLLKANQDQVIRRLKRELLRDRTKTRVSEVSRLGLVQMTRKNVSQGLVESFSTKCEHCNGLGRVLDLPD